jgi:hypothetical protein
LVTDRDAIDAVANEVELPEQLSRDRFDSVSAAEEASKVADRARSSINKEKVGTEFREEVEIRFRDVVSGGWTETESTSLASQFQSAISAVDEVDILRDEPNFLEMDYDRQDVSRTGNGVASRNFSISRRQVFDGKEDEEDDLEKQMLKVSKDLERALVSVCMGPLCVCINKF